MKVTGHQVRYVIALGSMFALVGVSAYVDGAIAAFAVAFLLVFVPIGSWLTLFRARPAQRILRIYDYFRKNWKRGYYFEMIVPAPAPRTQRFIIEWRFVELLLPTLGLSAYFAEKITSVRTGSAVALAAFLGFAILVLAVSSFLLIAIWVYEDSGFREHDADSTTVGVPLSRVKSFLVYGGLGAYLSFSSTLAGSFSGALGLTIAVVLFFGPVDYLIVTRFDARMRRRAIRGVREKAASRGFPFKTMKVT